MNKWNKEKVIQQILKLRTQGTPLNASSLMSSHRKIYAAALYYYGSLENAIVACGIDYSEINLRSSETRWSKEGIIKEIKRLHSQDVPLYYHYIKLHYPKLSSAAHNHYRSWKNAITTAGYNYNDIKKKRDAYTAEEIQQIIIKLFNDGVDLSHAGLKKSKYAGMVVSASHMFDGWANAVSSVGINYSDIRRKRPNWTKREIVSIIKELYMKGIDISFSGLKNSKYAGMVQVARRQDSFGGWDNAIKAAGLDYSMICKNRNTESARGLALQRTFEEAVRVLKLPLELRVKGFRYNGELCIPDFIDTVTGAWIDVKIHSWSGGIDNTVNKYLKHIDELWIYHLLGSLRTWHDKRVKFKSIKDFFPDLKRKRRNDLINKFEEIAKTNANSIVFDTWAKKWNRKAVLSFIKEKHKNGLSVHARDIQNELNGLYKAAVKYFRSWPLALEAAGINYDEIKYFDEWSPESVKKGILELYNAGADMSHTGIHEKHPTLLWAAIRYFEKWSKVVEVCGIDYSKYLRQEKWTRERVLKELKKIIKRGEDLSYTGTRRRHPKLLVAAERYFETWQKALNFLGVDYSTIRRQKKWTRELVIENIIDIIKRKEILNSYYIQKNNRPLYSAARRYYDGWDNAVKIAIEKRVMGSNLSS